MITNKYTFQPEIIPYIPKGFQETDALYFDIETTGLSAQTSYVYLIGCAIKTENGYELTQWICTEPSEEKEMIRLFFEKCKDFKLLIHYNGTGFDLPFLTKKAERHLLSCPLSKLQSLDLFNVIRKQKAWFPLPDLKLKTMERFFSLKRTDTFSGGDLIEVNAKFLGLHKINQITHGTKAEEENALLHVLLLHNAEDIMNLPSLTAVHRLFELPKLLLQDEFSYHRQEGFLIFDFIIPVYFPDTIKFSIPLENHSLTVSFQRNFSGNNEINPSSAIEKDSPIKEVSCISLSLPLYCGELKHFYKNPADYFYLPEEDSVIHKSLGNFLAKDCRKKATAANCYTRHEGIFLPIASIKNAEKKPGPEAHFSEQKTFDQKKTAATDLSGESTVFKPSLPLFCTGYKSNYFYTPFTEELFLNKEKLFLLVTNLLTSLLPSL